MDRQNIFTLLIFFSLCVSSSFCSPIVSVLDPTSEITPFIPAAFCLLPPELDYEGSVKFLEDCESLGRYETLPLPASAYSKLGTHPVVCCPKVLPESAICFESDAWCPNFKPPPKVEVEIPQDYDSDGYEDIPQVNETPFFIQETPKMSDKQCSVNGAYSNVPGFGNLTSCVPINRCGKILDDSYAPQKQVLPCGFDEESSLLMICCPEDLVTSPVSMTQKPRFPRNGRARPVDDLSKECRKWKSNGGCSLDKDFVISKQDPLNGKILSKMMFDFMQGACLKSCGWDGRKGCVDEHPRCSEWAKKAQCILNPNFMSHTCRESCGVCGFLSSHSKEEQVVNGRSYTDFSKSNFDCGRFKKLCEINNEDCEAKIETKKETENEEPDILFDLRSEDNSDVFFAADDTKSPDDYFCGATMINDRWIVAAAHCYDDFQISADNQARKVKINTIRDNTENIEIVEIKRVYKHPAYQYPKLYDDIAVIELGRRVEYNFDKFGDAPSCLDQNLDKIGRLATVQGYGLTETGERGELLETNVTVITNDDCKRILDFNATSSNSRKKIDNALPFGLNYGLLCARGEMNEKGVFRGSCKGDSGGPLFMQNDDRRQTLIGIVSGGIGCGKGYPGWYTKVSFHSKWIKCIIDRSALYGNNYEKVQAACKGSVEKKPACATNDDLIFGDLRSIDSDVEICLNGGSVSESNSDSDVDLRQIK